MDEPAPAPCSTRISSPAALSLPSCSGTRATRRSPGAVSLATPTFMGTTLTEVAGAAGRGAGPRWTRGVACKDSAGVGREHGTAGCGSGSKLLGALAQGDDEEMTLLVADDLGVVRDGAIPADVVARTEFDDMVALRHPPPAAQDEVVLVAGVSVHARSATDRRDALDDHEV